MKLYELKQKKTADVVLAGTSGTANIIIDGVSYLATFNASLTTTASDFDTAHSAALTAVGITVTNATGTLTFEGVNSGRTFSVEVAPATGNLGGAVAVSKPGGNFEIAVDQLQDQGNFTILEVRDLKDYPSTSRNPLADDVANVIAGHPVLQRGLPSSQKALFDYATANDMTLVKKNEDGSSPSTLVTES